MALRGRRRKTDDLAVMNKQYALVDKQLSFG